MIQYTGHDLNTTLLSLVVGYWEVKIGIPSKSGIESMTWMPSNRLIFRSIPYYWTILKLAVKAVNTGLVYYSDPRCTVGIRIPDFNQFDVKTLSTRWTERYLKTGQVLIGIQSRLSIVILDMYSDPSVICLWNCSRKSETNCQWL